MDESLGPTSIRDPVFSGNYRIKLLLFQVVTKKKWFLCVLRGQFNR